jgi:hypothetical protein
VALPFCCSSASTRSFLLPSCAARWFGLRPAAGLFAFLRDAFGLPDFFSPGRVSETGCPTSLEKAA